eukprot:CAMPEP_0174894244 /NCGR_PEP_ID=MMETSP0167-20121228/8915_1 /TAXON_ID=38298 /ORGANISM="Rhodella maculata, Strain CCMP736" /LENGTH=98 /DNA_ID=CAMNT_0016133273 /DNA_START=44 /DNA_END=336 /DNA_ORIENTATION=-
MGSSNSTLSAAAASPTSNTLFVAGFPECPYFQQAACAARKFQEFHPNRAVHVAEIPREAWLAVSAGLRRAVAGAADHMTSPLVAVPCGWIPEGEGEKG